MYRLITNAIVAIVLGGIVQTPVQFSIRAASSEAVQGWERMELESKVVWVAPTASLTSADIARAEAITTPDGKRAVSIEFTDAGTDKMRRLSTAQKDKLIAMVLDGKLIWAPLVRSEMGKQALLTGNGPNGLPEAVVQRILAGVKR